MYLRIVGLEGEWMLLVNLLGLCAHALLLSICPHTACTRDSLQRPAFVLLEPLHSQAQELGVLGVSVHMTLLQPALPND